MRTRKPIDELGFLDELVSSLHDPKEAIERLGRSPSGTVNVLKRMRDEGLVDRVRRGHYTIRQLGVLKTRAAAEHVALAVGAAFSDQPHRMAYLSALDDHDLLTRPVRTIFVATTKRVFGDRRRSDERLLRLAERLHSLLALARNDDACHPRCPGWAVFDSDEYGPSIQRCDDCGRFETDDAARRHVKMKLCMLGLAAVDDDDAEYYCRECGSTNVEHEMWVAINEDRPTGDAGSWNSYANAWCNDCQKHNTLICRSDYDFEEWWTAEFRKKRLRNEG